MPAFNKKTITAYLAVLLTIQFVQPAEAAWKLFGEKEKTETTVETETELPEDSFIPKRGNRSPGISGKTKATSDCEKSNKDNILPVNTQGWYFVHRTDGTQPPIPPEMQYITKYNGYCVDTKHTDMKAEDKVIYLTFDAGYENGNITKILDILKEENVPAAFFVLENLVAKDTALVKRMVNEGHLICNHTARHKDLTKAASKDEFRNELEKMENIYTDATGETMAKYYRPPEGKTNEQTMQWADELGYKTIFWSYAYADWDNDKQMPPEKALEKVLAGTHNGEVLLLHPTSATNAEILDDLIHAWKEMGFRFGTLDELTEVRGGE